MKKLYTLFTCIFILSGINSQGQTACFIYSSVNNVPYCEGVTLIFTDCSIGATSWEWNFGPNAVPQFSNSQFPGLVNFPTCNLSNPVTLTINGGGSAAFIATQNIPIFCNPTACFTVANPVQCAGSVFNFNSGCSTVGAGSSSLSYLWDMCNGQQLNSANPSYIYPDNSGCFCTSLIVTNNHGCTAFTSQAQAVCIMAPPTFQISSVLNCQQNSIDFCATSIIGGTPPYTYAWNFPTGTPATSSDSCPQNISYSSAQFYNANCIITDANGCSSLSQNILVIGEIGTIPVITTNPSCGNLNGSIDLVLPQGTFSYEWSNGETTQDLNNVGGGIYSVTVANDSGCTVTVIDTLVNMNNLLLSETHIDATSGNTDGSINLSATGGTSPYNYLWSNGSTTQDISNLSAGNYSVTVTDINGCSSSLNIILLNICPLTFNITSTDSTTCTAALVVNFCAVNILGGIPPFTYSWTFQGGIPVTSTDSCPQNINYTIGTYSVSCTVTDANGCSNTVTLTNYINVGTGIFLATNNIDATCGNSNGSIDLSVNGGIIPIEYNWSNGATTQDLNNLSAGIYSVTVTDANNCGASMSITIVNHPAPTITVNHIDASCLNCHDGSATVLINGGTPPYTIQWNTGSNDNPIINIDPGVYQVCVTDANGCSVCDSVTVGYAIGINSITENDFVQIIPNPNNGIFTLHFSSSVKPEQIEVYNLLGEKIYSLPNTEWKQNTQLNFSFLSDGIYFLKIESAQNLIMKKIVISRK